MKRIVSIYKTIWPLKAPFRITGVTFTDANALVVQITEKGVTGRGEGMCVYYIGETLDTMADQAESIREDLENGADREALRALLPVGGARNAIDNALWDLEVRQQNTSVWEMTGINPKPVQSVYTIGIDTAEEMAAHAAWAKKYPVLKIKLDGETPVERMRAIRNARPDASLVIDANQGFTMEQLDACLPKFKELNVDMVEQPLPRGDDDELIGYKSPVTLCADESCLDTSELAAALPKYDMINIKLDKTGGLTEALDLAKAAKAEGKKLMVGNMVGTSLSMMPSFVIAQLCDFVDLDGPLWLKSDYPDGITYDRGMASEAAPGFWGTV